MKNTWIKFCGWATSLRGEQGQDLIEYALVAALIAFAAVASMGTLAEKINSSFSIIGSKLGSAAGV